MLVHIEDQLITGGHVLTVAKQVAIAIANVQLDGGDRLIEVKCPHDTTPSELGIYVEYHGDLPRYAHVTPKGELVV